MAYPETASPATMRPSRGSWSEDEVRTLITMWRTHEIQDIAKRLGRNSNAISIKASRLSLPPRTQTKSVKAVRTSNPKARVRPCLSCQTPFFSEGSHHRICDRCKSTEAWRTGGSNSLSGQW